MYRKVAPLKGPLFDPSFKKRGGTNVLRFSAQYLVIGSISGVIMKVSFSGYKCNVSTAVGSSETSQSSPYLRYFNSLLIHGKCFDVSLLYLH